MKAKTIKQLLKDYDLNSDMEYFELIVESVFNGQRTQAKAQFMAMERKYRKTFVASIYGNWNSGLNSSDRAMFMNLL